MSVDVDGVKFLHDSQNVRKDRWLIAFTGAVVCFFLALLALSIHNPGLEPFVFVVVLSYSFVSAIRFVVYSVGGALFSVQQKKLDSEVKFNDFGCSESVSILMPAYNEAQVIGSVLRSFENLNYKNFEIIVIDDGSKDDTYQVASEAALHLNLDIKVFTKPNAGKAEALNFGIEKSTGDFILCMDSDSYLNPDAVRKGIRHFANDEKLAAVAGVVFAENTNCLLAQFQQLDYLIGHFQRKILSLIGKVSIVPGPIGLFRKSAVASVGYYEKDKGTFAEDTELTFRLIAAGWKVKCEDGMLAYTEAPDNVSDLLRQRYRWSRGVYQALFKNFNRFIFSQSQSNLLFLMFLIWEQVLVPIVDFALLVAFLCHFIFNFDLSGYSVLIAYIVGLDLSLALLSTWNQKNPLRWFAVAVLSRFSYVNILLTWKLLAFFDEWKDVGMDWDKLTRKGFANTGGRL